MDLYSHLKYCCDGILKLLIPSAFAGNSKVVVGLVEPHVVPDFLRDLESKRWVLVRVNAYKTRWARPGCAKQVVERIEKGALDAMVFTSTAEVEGLLKSFKDFGLDWEMAKKTCPKMLVVAHGPIMAAGAHMLGVRVDLASKEDEMEEEGELEWEELEEELKLPEEEEELPNEELLIEELREEEEEELLPDEELPKEEKELPNEQLPEEENELLKEEEELVPEEEE
ncbi:hypothetical protein ACE6H2_006251 [Prunus campanulata]